LRGRLASLTAFAAYDISDTFIETSQKLNIPSIGSDAISPSILAPENDNLSKSDIMKIIASMCAMSNASIFLKEVRA
jgi:hypothetical protein